MLNKSFILIVLMSYYVGLAQENNFPDKHQAYTQAISILQMAKQTLPKDSMAIKTEWEHLQHIYKQEADSLKLAGNSQAYVLFEANRLLQKARSEQALDAFNAQLDSLFSHAAAYPELLIDNPRALNTIAQTTMGMNIKGLTDEQKISAINTQSIVRLYNMLDTKKWDADKKQWFISMFVKQYANQGIMVQAEYIYRAFDSIFVTPKQLNRITNYSLSKDYPLVDGLLRPTNKSWQNLSQGKIVLRPEREHLFYLTYLINLLKAKNKKYPGHDVVILRDSTILSDAFLQALKRNLHFNNYYIATYPKEDEAQFNSLPDYIKIEPNGSLDYYDNNVVDFFVKLNAPVQAERDAYAAGWEEQKKKREEDRQKQAAQPMDVSEKYRDTVEGFTVILKGKWPEDLALQVIRLTSNEQEHIFQIDGHYGALLYIKSQDYPIHKLPVLVRHNAQVVELLRNQKGELTAVDFGKKAEQLFYDSCSTIDQLLKTEQYYKTIAEQYPFKQSRFMAYISARHANLKKEIKDKLNRYKPKKYRSLLKRLIDQLIEERIEAI